MVRAWALLLLGLGACSPTVDVRVPEIAGYLATITAARSNGSALLAASDGARVLPLTGSFDTLAVLGYGETLASMHLAGGPLPLANGGEGTPLSTPDRIWIASVTEGAIGDWVEAAELPSWLAAVRLTTDAPTAEECIAQLGCFADHESFERVRCEQPCAVAQAVPTSPQPVQMECPPRWSPIAEGEQRACAPPERRATCAPGEAQWIDEQDCAPIFAACPSLGGFAEIPSGGSAIYVDEVAPLGGDGSKAAPLKTLAEAFAIAMPGDWVALAGGVYLAYSLTIPSGVHLIGACPGEAPESSRVEGGIFGGLRVTGSSTIAGITLSAPGLTGISIAAGARLHLKGVEMIGVQGIALSVEGALSTDRVTSRGFNIVVHRTGTSSPLWLSRMVISLAHSTAIVLEGGGQVNLEDSVITDGEQAAVRTLEPYQRSSPIVVKRSLFARHRQVTMHLVGFPVVTLSDLVLLDTVFEDVSDRIGDGQAFFQAGGNLVVERVRLERHRIGGLQLSDVQATVSQLWGADIVTDRGGGLIDAGRGLVVVNRMYANEVFTGIAAYQANIIASDVTIQGSSVGALVVDHSTLSLSRAAITGVKVFGVLQDLGVTSIRDTRFEGGANGVLVRAGQASLVSVAIDRPVITDDLPIDMAIGNTSGVGLWATRTTTVTLQQFLISGAARAGVRLDSPYYQLTNGIFRANRIGAWVSRLELERITKRVRYEDNGATHIEL